ncbi:MAG: NTP transferase domain-containing protein [Mogibacterium sp.]|nr:NTP transferase domain-containing protein [Mogibacterium sp.]
MRYGAVIIASGMSRRAQRFKQLVKTDDAILTERVITNFRRAGVRDIVVVTGQNAEQIEKELRDFDIIFLRNEQYETSQMLDSAKIGLEYLKGRCDRIFFCPEGVPFFTDQTVTEEMKKMDSDSSIKVVVPGCNCRKGHPLLISGSAVDEILAYDGERGMKGAYDAMPEGSVACITVDDIGTVQNVNSRDDYLELIDAHNRRILHPEIRLTFASTSRFFGPGTVGLLQEIEKCGNVREACERCGFSYSKGWKILKRCEERLGYSVVERQPGGQSGGSARVTDKGRDLLAVYEELKTRLTVIAEEQFRQLMEEYRLADSDTTEEKR